MLSQISAVKALPAEFWAALGALITGTVVIVKKLVARRQKPKPEYITRAEFHQGMDAVRDRVGASYLAVSDKLEANHKEVLASLHELAAASERRLDAHEAALARLDERTHPLIH
jgi:hypothetical protein